MGASALCEGPRGLFINRPVRPRPHQPKIPPPRTFILAARADMAQRQAGTHDYRLGASQRASSKHRLKASRIATMGTDTAPLPRPAHAPSVQPGNTPEAIICFWRTDFVGIGQTLNRNLKVWQKQGHEIAHTATWRHVLSKYRQTQPNARKSHYSAAAGVWARFSRYLPVYRASARLRSSPGTQPAARPQRTATHRGCPLQSLRQRPPARPTALPAARC